MTHWESLRAHVAASYPVHTDERQRFHHPDWDGLSVWVATSRGHRLVALLRRKDYNDDWYLLLSAPIATRGLADPVALLEWSGRSTGGTLIMAEGDLFYRRAYPLEWLDRPRLVTALNGVASTSASLEAMLAEHGSI